MINGQSALANGVEYQSIIDSIIENDDSKTSFYKIFIDMVWSKDPEKIDLLALAKLAMKDHAAAQFKHALSDPGRAKPCDSKQGDAKSSDVMSDFIAEVWSVEGKSVAKLDFDNSQAANANDAPSDEASASEEKTSVDADQSLPAASAVTDQHVACLNGLDAALPTHSDQLSEPFSDDVYGPSFAEPGHESQADVQDDAVELAPAPVYNMQDIMMMIFNDKNQREQAELNSAYDDYGYMYEAA